jgi:protein phosphatase
MYLSYAGVTDIGAVRPENQDVLVADGFTTGRSGASLRGHHIDVASLGRPLVFGVVDGMGGHEGGAEAAGFIAMRLAGVTSEMGRDEWQGWLAKLDGHVGEVGRVIGMPRMGATLALLAFYEGRFASVNLGDCRSYRLMDGLFVQVSVDDLIGGQPGGVTQALGGGGRGLSGHEQAVDIHYKDLPYAAFADRPERFLVCSDGLYGAAGRDDLSRLLSAPGDVSAACDGIAAFVREREAKDNFTFVVIEVGLDW